MRTSVQKRRIEIIVRNGEDSLHNTHDVINGRLNLCLDEDTIVKEVSITLEGEAIVCVNNISSLLHNGGNVFGKHKFLRMSQPIPSALLPENGIALAGKSYEFPFSFTVPEYLLPYACSHGKTQQETLRERHLSLPPSLGDFETADVSMQDLGPSTAKVNYKIFARIKTTSPCGVMTRTEKSVRVRIIPTTNLRVGPSICEIESHNDCNKIKELCRLPCINGRTAGQLEVKSKPVYVCMKDLHSAKVYPVTTKLALDLRFEPAMEGEKPPQLVSLKTILRSSTFLGQIPYKELPALCNRLESSPEFTRYVATAHLTSNKFSEVAWSKEEDRIKPSAMDLPDYDLVSEASSISRGTSNTGIKGYHLPVYSARVCIPVQIPNPDPNQRKKRLMIPTFHSCIVARTYSLELDLIYKAQPLNPSSTGRIFQHVKPSSNVKLIIPLHIGLESEPRNPVLDTISQEDICQQQCVQESESSTDDSRFSGLPDYAGGGLPPPYAPHL